MSDLDQLSVSGDERESCESNEIVSASISSKQEAKTNTSTRQRAQAETIPDRDDPPLQDDAIGNDAIGNDAVSQGVNPYYSSNNL